MLVSLLVLSIETYIMRYTHFGRGKKVIFGYNDVSAEELFRVSQLLPLR